MAKNQTILRRSIDKLHAEISENAVAERNSYREIKSNSKKLQDSMKAMDKKIDILMQKVASNDDS